MAKDFNLGTDTRLDIGSNTGGDTRADFGGDLASDDGVDLNDGDVMNKSHVEPLRGAVGNFVRGAAEWSGENPPQAHSNPLTYFGQMAFAGREALGQAAYHGLAAMMETYIDQHGGSPKVESNMLEIDQAIENGAESAERTEPIEPFNDDQRLYDSETGIELTDERLQGYDSIDDVPQEKLNEIRNNEITEGTEQSTETKSEPEPAEAPVEVAPESELIDASEGD